MAEFHVYAIITGRVHIGIVEAPNATEARKLAEQMSVRDIVSHGVNVTHREVEPLRAHHRDDPNHPMNSDTGE